MDRTSNDVKWLLSGAKTMRLTRLTTDRVSQKARRWSNAELRKFAHLFSGDIVNVSAWRDEDKEGRRYRDYFGHARTYMITNFNSDTRGLQGWRDEVFLDLEKQLPPELERRFDVVFNHTTLEHVYECRRAFANLCAMSRDVVIVVVPFLQPYHSRCGDFWRFSPLTVQRLFEENAFQSVYLSFNDQLLSSVYIFAVGVRNLDRWADTFRDYPASVDPLTGGHIGRRAIPSLSVRTLLGRMRGKLRVFED